MFYDAFNSERDDNYYEKLKCKIPFLNGGLFEPIDNYNWHTTKLIISDELIKKIIDTFDRYNFTIKEDEPLERDVAVDPEMLGKVFENLISENLRKGTGSYYTKRDIVQYMCRNLVSTYVSNSLGDRLSKEDILNLFLLDKGDEERLKEFKKFSDFLHKILQSLDNIKICDPAVGSGAFPVQLMNECILLKLIVHKILGTDYDLYKLKRSFIENNLFAVDIDPGAIEIVKLRLWLSLIIDEQDFDNIKPLPNLEYKILQGNSLIQRIHNIDFSGRQLDIFRKSQIEEISNNIIFFQKEYFNTTSRSKKNEIKLKINNLFIDLIKQELDNLPKKLQKINEKLIEEIKNLTGSTSLRNFFLWKIFFSEVFSGGGFDIVIGNPPYIRHERLGESKEDLKSNYTIFNNSADIYTYFFELSHTILRENGLLCLITSNKFTKANYANNLRKFIKNQFKVIEFLDFRNVKVFDTAQVYTCISLLKKSLQIKEYKVPFKFNLHEDNKNQFLSSSNLKENYFTFAEDKCHAIKSEIDKRKYNNCLKVNFYLGIKSGLKKAFIIETNKRNTLVKKSNKSKDIIFKVLEGKNIDQYNFSWNNLWLINSHNGIRRENLPRINVKKDYKVIYDYLSEFKRALIRRGDKGAHWTNLRDCKYLNVFKRNRIVYSDISDSPKFSMCVKNYYTDNTVYNTNCNSYAVLGLLNSSLFNFYYRMITNSFGNQSVRLFTQYIQQFPILKNITEFEKEIKNYILNIISEENQNIQFKYKEKIDEIVFKVYELKQEEIYIISKELNKSS